MQNMKRCISVLLAIVMLASAFVFSVSAGVPELDASASQNIAMKLEVEHEDGTPATTVSPGETIVAKLYVTAKSAEARIAGGAVAMFFNSDVYTFVSRTFGLESVDPASLYAVNNTDAFYTNTVKKFTATESSYGWNIGANIQIKNLAGYNNTSASLIKENAATPFLTVVFKVNDSVEPGTSAPIGIPETSVAPLNSTRQNYTYIQTYTASDKTIVQNKSKSLYVLNTIATDLVVGAAEEPFPSTSIVKPLKGQIRFNKDGNNKLTSFDVRVIAVISKADFESKFAEGEAAEAPGVIKDIGFVFAAGSNVPDMTFGNVKKVVEGGETVTGYTKKEVTFISTSIDSPNYVFTCMVAGMGKDAYSNKLLAVAYIAYADADGNAVYCYYPAVQEVSYKDLIEKWYGSSFSTDFAE